MHTEIHAVNAVAQISASLPACLPEVLKTMSHKAAHVVSL
jgi:hypothetical protein